MKKHHRHTIIWFCLLATLSMTAMFAYGQLHSSKARSVQAKHDLALCLQLAKQIKSLSDRPHKAGSEEMQQTEITQRIEQAAIDSNIPSDRLIRIWPEAARRAGDSPYREKPTQVLLKEVTLQQMTTFFYILSTASRNSLHLKSLRITAPRNEQNSNLWTAEATLTYFIFSPVTRSGSTTHTLSGTRYNP